MRRRQINRMNEVEPDQRDGARPRRQCTSTSTSSGMVCFISRQGSIPVSSAFATAIRHLHFCSAYCTLYTDPWLFDISCQMQILGYAFIRRNVRRGKALSRRVTQRDDLCFYSPENYDCSSKGGTFYPLSRKILNPVFAHSAVLLRYAIVIQLLYP